MFMRVVNTGSTHGNCYVLKSNTGEILLLDCGCRYKDILKAIDYRTSDVLVYCLVMSMEITSNHFGN